MNIESDKELEIRKNLMLVFIPIAIMAFTFMFYQSNSLNYNKKKYLDSRNTNFNGIVIKKRQEGNYTRADRFVLLDNYHEERVENSTYSKIKIGDSVYKKRGSDSVCYILKNGEIIFEDYNKYIREEYFKLLTKKEEF